MNNMTYRCKQCEKIFKTNESRRKFCCLRCCWDWRIENRAAGQFRRGQKAWNANTKGVMKPNRTSFKKGLVPKNKTPIGSVRYREGKNGELRAWIKISDNGSSYDWKLRAVLVWEKAYGNIPRGIVIHHKDRNTLNDKLKNLQAMTRAKHLQEHRDDFTQKRMAKIAKAS